MLMWFQRRIKIARRPYSCWGYLRVHHNCQLNRLKVPPHSPVFMSCLSPVNHFFQEENKEKRRNDRLWQMEFFWKWRIAGLVKRDFVDTFSASGFWTEWLRVQIKKSITGKIFQTLTTFVGLISGGSRIFSINCKGINIFATKIVQLWLWGFDFCFIVIWVKWIVISGCCM